MPRFEPFQGLRYRPEVAPVAQVIAPPYDVISATERSHLASRHRANAVLVELPEADLSRGRDRLLLERVAEPLAGRCGDHANFAVRFAYVRASGRYLMRCG